MDATAINFAIQIIEALLKVIPAISEAYKLASNSVTALKVMQAEGRDPTTEEWDALNATVQKLRDERPSLD